MKTQCNIVLALHMHNAFLFELSSLPKTREGLSTQLSNMATRWIRSIERPFGSVMCYVSYTFWPVDFNDLSMTEKVRITHNENDIQCTLNDTWMTDNSWIKIMNIYKYTLVDRHFIMLARINKSFSRLHPAGPNIALHFVVHILTKCWVGN